MTKIARPALDAPAAEWLVYGDALQEAGDPRGELVGLSHGVDEGRTGADVRDAYVREHARALLGLSPGDLAPYTFRWRFSELAGVEVRVGPADDGAALVRTILDAPAAELLPSVTLIGVTPGPEDSVDLSNALEVLADVERVTSLHLVDARARNAGMLVSRDFDPDENRVTFGSLAPFWERLEHLSFDVADSYALTDLENVDAPALRSFALRNLRFCDWEDAQTMTNRLAGAKWPKLESFELRLVESFVANVPNEIDPYIAIYSAEDYEGRDDTDDGDSEGIAWDRELPRVFATLKGCPLKRLALTSFESSRVLLEAVVQSGLVPTLDELDLSDSALRDDDIDELGEDLEVLRSLKRLVVRNTSLTEAGVAELNKLCPQVEYSGGATGARYRYVVGQE